MEQRKESYRVFQRKERDRIERIKQIIKNKEVVPMSEVSSTTYQVTDEEKLDLFKRSYKSLVSKKEPKFTSEVELNAFCKVNNITLQVNSEKK